MQSGAIFKDRYKFSSAPQPQSSFLWNDLLFFNIS
jgi:hypothetical protein